MIINLYHSREIGRQVSRKHAEKPVANFMIMYVFKSREIGRHVPRYYAYFQIMKRLTISIIIYALRSREIGREVPR